MAERQAKRAAVSPDLPFRVEVTLYHLQLEQIVEKELKLSKVNCTFGRQRPKAGEGTQHNRRDV